MYHFFLKKIFKIDILATLHHATKITFCGFFLCDFTIVMGDALVSGFDGKYKVTVYRFQTLNLTQIDNLRFTNCFEKTNKKCMLWHDET